MRLRKIKCSNICNYAHTSGWVILCSGKYRKFKDQLSGAVKGIVCRI